VKPVGPTDDTTAGRGVAAERPACTRAATRSRPPPANSRESAGTAAVDCTPSLGVVLPPIEISADVKAGKGVRSHIEVDHDRN
jgi:hypothetical protein